MTDYDKGPVGPDESGAGYPADSSLEDAPLVPVPDEPAEESLPPAPAEDDRPRGAGRAGCVAAVVALLVASTVGVAAGFAGARLAMLDNEPTRRTVTVVEGDTDEPVTAAAAVAVPSVVNIDVATRAAAGDSDLPSGHPGVPVTGSGSGVAYKSDPEGGTYILTNDHVVDDATRISVTDSEGEKYTAVVVGADPETDIAVVRVDAAIPLIALGDSDAVNIGDLVVAIGSPFGLQQSVSSGVVSAIGRSVTTPSSTPGRYPLVDVIQTDAAINPGNSGGALLNRQGELIGINTAIFSESGANDGIGFAIPSNRVASVADQLIEGGEADSPFLGILGQTITEVIAAEEDLPVDEGALVVEVTENTGADDAGILKGDIIVRFDNRKIRSMDDLIFAVRKTAVGDKIKVELYRDGEKIETTVEIKPKPDVL